MQELAVLQSTLYALQQQQMMQLNLIQQLQQQLHIQSADPASVPANSAELGSVSISIDSIQFPCQLISKLTNIHDTCQPESLGGDVVHPQDPEEKTDAGSDVSSRASTPRASPGVDAGDAGQPITATSRNSSDVRKLEALVMDADASAATRNLFTFIHFVDVNLIHRKYQ